MKKPSDYKTINPIASVFGKSEYETVAHNIIRILYRTGDTFRELPFDEYKTERLKDGNFSNGEEMYFNAVVGFTVNPESAGRFSKAWKI